MTDSSNTSYSYCALPYAAYASRPDQSRGRIYDEPESKMRKSFQRDRDRIIHCSAFRRLKYKTQVFVAHEGDDYRTRLTHSLEVAQIARSLARALMVDEDLAEGIALAHDLGHTPFAHIGEDALKECMQPYGGFDHNDQSLRILTYLEHSYPGWRGLNLSWETLEGVVKHNGPVKSKDLQIALKSLQKQKDFQLSTYASLEAQIAGLADDIAYNNHDVQDGLNAGLFTLADLKQLALIGPVVTAVEDKYPNISEHLKAHEVVREMIGAMVEDVFDETNRRLLDVSPNSADDIRAAGKAMVAFSSPMLDKVNELRGFLFDRMYLSAEVGRIRYKIKRVVRGLFEAYFEEPGLLPDYIKENLDIDKDSEKARAVADYIASLTDPSAFKEYGELYG